MQKWILITAFSCGLFTSHAQQPTPEHLNSLYAFVLKESQRNFPDNVKTHTPVSIKSSDVENLPGSWSVTYFAGIQGFEETRQLRIQAKRWQETRHEQAVSEQGYWTLLGDNKLVLIRDDHEPRAFLVMINGEWSLLDGEGETSFKPMRKLLSKETRINSSATADFQISKPNPDLFEQDRILDKVPFTIGKQGLTLVPKGNCEVHEDNGTYVVEGNGRLETIDELTPPMTIHTRAKTDITNIRLYYGRGSVILNWELNPQELRIRDPNTAKRHRFPGKGFVVVGRWHDIEWVIENTLMRLFVDGEQRAAVKGNYKGMRAKAGIGPAYGSRLTISNFHSRSSK